MPDINIPFGSAGLPAYHTTPLQPGPHPGVVVVHDALGMSTDLRNQCDWLAEANFLATAPDLFDGKTLFSCLFRAIRELRKREGQLFEKVDAVRQHLLSLPECNGKVGVIGFCFGGGFAVLLSADFGFDSSSVNYGGTLPPNAEKLLERACPIVASYGALDRGSKGVAKKLEYILDKHGIDHDIKEYPDTDHSFMNDHDPGEVPWTLRIIGQIFGAEYNAESSMDARKRIIAFFNRHLRTSNTETI